MTASKPLPELAEPTQAVSDIWASVDRLIERLDAEGASQHGVAPLVAARLRSRGEELLEVPLAVELHKTVKSPTGLRPPSTQALFEAAVPAAVDVPGLLAPAPLHHAVLLAGHAWAERPLERLRDLIDVAAVAASLDASELSQVAAEWGW